MKKTLAGQTWKAGMTVTMGIRTLFAHILVASIGLSASAALAAVPDPEIGALVSGTSSYVGGTFVWTDYAYDDRGPDTQGGGAPTEGNPALAGGDATYPPSAAPGNAADLIQLQIGLNTVGPPASRGVTIKAVLETLIHPELPLLAVAFDTDNDPTTGAPALPGSWAPQGPLGVELVLLISASGGEVLKWQGDAWSMIATVPAIVDADANVMQATLPFSVANPGTGTWRAFAALGLAGPGGTVAGSWLEGASPIYDLAFVGDEPFYGWQDRRQADVLAGAIASSNAAASIDFGKIAAGVTELVDPMTTGFHTFLYHSRLQLAEGILTLSNGTHQFNGPYQPYLVYVPAVITAGHPLIINMHGANVNHLGSVFLFPPGIYLGTGRPLSEELYLIAPFAPDGVNFPPTVLTVYPLARGETLGYVGVAEQDVLDVADDAVRRFGTEPDRVTLSGASMGGIGTFRLGTLYPDRWAAAIPVIGYAQSTVSDLLANFGDVPVRQINGLLDPLVSHVLAEHTAQQLHTLLLDHRFWLLDQRGHEGGGFVYQCVYDQAQHYVRNLNPPHVLYRVNPSMFNIDATTGLNLQYDSAYWLSGITVQDGAPWGDAEARSHALPQRERLLTEVNADFSNLAGGESLCGPDPSVPPTKDTWHELSWVISGGSVLPQSNVLDLTLQSLAALTVDLTRAGFGAGEFGTIEVSTDSAVSLRLMGLRHNQRVQTDTGEEISADLQGAVSVPISIGAHEIALLACNGQKHRGCDQGHNGVR